MNTHLVLVDSDAFISSLRKTDKNHERAKKITRQLISQNFSFVTSNYVFSEVVTVLSLREGRDLALDFIRQVKNPASQYETYWIERSIEEIAIEIYKKQTSKNVSFTDCTNMALMELHNIPLIFSFDRIYRKNGYKMTK